VTRLSDSCPTGTRNLGGRLCCPSIIIIIDTLCGGRPRRCGGRLRRCGADRGAPFQSHAHTRSCTKSRAKPTLPYLGRPSLADDIFWPTDHSSWPFSYQSIFDQAFTEYPAKRVADLCSRQLGKDDATLRIGVVHSTTSVLRGGELCASAPWSGSIRIARCGSQAERTRSKATGHTSLNAIAGQLNARKVATANGGQWRHGQVRQILQRASASAGRKTPITKAIV
jgi:hypothetical protein